MTRPGIFDVTVQIWRKEGDHPMSDGNRNAGREALPAGPERPSITLPAELAVHLGRELSASAVDDNGWTDLHYAAALDRPGVARVLLGGRSAVERAAADRRRAARPGAAEHAEPLRPGPVQPVPPDRRAPAAHRCAEGHAPPALGGVGRRRGRGRSAAVPRGKHPCASGRRQQAVGCCGGQARLEGGARCCCRAAPVRGRRTTTAPPPSWIQVRGRCIDTRAADDEWSVAHRNRNSGR